MRRLVNIQSGYPAFFKFSDSGKPVVVQSPCDGLVKAIQQYRRSFSGSKAGATVKKDATTYDDKKAIESLLKSVIDPPLEPNGKRTKAPCGKCGTNEWLRIDGCDVCQGCGYSKCG